MNHTDLHKYKKYSHRRGAGKTARTAVVCAVLALFALAAVLTPSRGPAGVYAADGSIVPDIPLPDEAVATATNSALYQCTAEKLTAAQAAAEGLPEGYTDNVLVLRDGEDGVGCVFDLSGYELSAYGTVSLTVRAYVPTNVREVNLAVAPKDDDGRPIANAKTEDLVKVARYSVAGYEKNTWTDYVFYYGGLNFADDYDMPDLANENGQLGVFSVNFRRATSSLTNEDGTPFEPPAPEPIYIDAIIIVTDPEAAGDPSITYDGTDLLDQTAGKPLQTGTAAAYDAYEQRELAVTTRWEGTPGTDDDGLAVEGGPYTLVYEAANSFGETVSHSITVTVRPRDTEPPYIFLSSENIDTEAGVYATMNFDAVDNEDEVKVKAVWSKNALDSKGRLLPGDHTLTLTAVDLTGNKTERTLTVHAAETDGLAAFAALPVTRDESEINFGLPVWAIVLIIAAGIAVLAAVAFLVVKQVGRKLQQAQAQAETKAEAEAPAEAKTPAEAPADAEAQTEAPAEAQSDPSE